MHHVAGAVTAWRNSDALPDQLIEIRNEAANDVALHDPSAAAIKHWAERIGAVDAALSTLAVDFSDHLGKASRQVSALLLLVNLVIAACLAGIVLFHTRRMLWRRWLAETALAVEKERAQLTLASIGDAVIVTTQDALRLADVACFLAKDKGRNRVQEHRPSDTGMAVRVAEMSWVNRIRKGLDEGRFCLYEQEIRPLTGAKGNERRELLLRLRDEGGALVPPGSFLPAAERYGLMPLIDRWVVRRAFEIIAERKHSPRKIASYAINLSGATIGDSDFVDFVAELFVQHDVSPALVCFEITETSAISNLDEAHKFIARLREIGCSFSLDDFGTGMSSIAYLKHLPVDINKIDGSFLKEILNSKVDRAMVEMITKTAKIMQKQVVAEFVESAAILEELRQIGVDYAQGYAIGKPVPVLTLWEEKIA
jgi:EAL domain-containing protein (putative c-di-GMP-specific phosphodiesterase class I)